MYYSFTLFFQVIFEFFTIPLFFVFCFPHRQPTPFDKICYDRVNGQQEQLGSRVYGDCDHLMKEIMKHMLDEEELQEWEEGRTERMDEYTKQRRSPNL